MPPEYAINEAEELRQQFKLWRRRFMFWKAVDSINVFSCCVLLASLSVFVVDYAVPFPWVLRLVLVIIMIITAAVFAVRVLRFLYYPPKFSALARGIRTQHARERSNLVAAGMLLDESLDFSPRDRATVQALSYARQQVRDWDWQRGIDRTKPLSWMIACILMVGAMLFLWNRVPSNLIVERWMSLLGSQGSQASTLTFVDPPASVFAGQDIRLHVKHDGPWAEDSIKLEIQGSVREVTRVENNVADVLSFQILNIQSPLRVRALAGAYARSEYLDIALRERPRVLSHEFAIAPPVYLNQSDYRSDKSSLSIPERSKANLRVLLNDSPRELHLTAASDAGTEVTFTSKLMRNIAEFDLSSLTDLNAVAQDSSESSKSVRYRISLFATQDSQDVISLDYPLGLQVQADAPPAFVILSPPLDRPNLTLMDIGQRLKVTVTDDYGIDSIVLTIHGVPTAKSEQGMPESRIVFERNFPASHENRNLRSFTVDETLDRDDLIAKFPLCNAIDCSLVAIDSAGQKSTSAGIRLLLHAQDSEQSQALDAISGIIELQRQLQNRTDQAALKPDNSNQLQGQLAAQQQDILDQWKQSDTSIQKESTKQERSANAIEQLMRTSQNNLGQGMFTESSNIQSGILHRLNQFASDLNSDSNAERNSDGVQSLENLVSAWSQQQSQVTEALKQHLEKIGAVEAPSLEATQAAESSLQKVIQRHLEAIEETSPYAWPLTQANKSIARATAKLQRNIADASTLADAQTAADMLKSLAESVSQRAQSGTSSEADSNEETGDQTTSAVIQELEIVQTLQSRLHDRLQSVQDSQDANTASATVRTIAQSQSELAQRTMKLSQALNEKQP